MSTATRDDLTQLRELLLVDERRRIDDLTERLDDPSRRSSEVGAVLPRAILDRDAEADDLRAALAPQVDDALTRAIRDDPATIAAAIAPIIMPAIRRSIQQALADLSQRLNQTVEHSLTGKGLRMRVEAIRTGVPFVEVVLRHSLVYRVEQLFVIHRDTSLLLAKAIDEDVATRDPDMISGMLTVVQGFVQDSLKVADEDSLDSMRVGDLSIWTEPGENFLLAAVIRGTPPQSLRQDLSELSSDLHAKYSTPLGAFDGDLSPFETMPHDLEPGLSSQRKQKKHAISPVSIILLILLVGLVAALVGSRFLDSRELGRFVTALDAEPGIQVVDAQRANGSFEINGLRDPFAADPATLATELGLDPERVRFRWEPFAAAAPSLVLARLEQLVDIPAGITLSSSETAIRIDGVSGEAWLREFRDRAGLIAPSVDVDVSGWVRDEGAADVISSGLIRYPIGSVELGPEGQSTVDRVADAWFTLDAERAAPILVIQSYLDGQGPRELNEQLRLARAEGVLSALVTRGLNPQRVRIELVEPGDDSPRERWIKFALDR